ncbi:MAG TPA: Asp23/Gls24 family envelope stress response protein, partial [Clostridia bacterium]|nr:Asp23/Gls24 family envelope stress response protein [Clostridia bacterium]
EDAIRVRLQTVMQTGVHIPKVTQQVREEITNYLMTCSGVRVSDVDIVVEDTKPAPDLPELLEPPARPIVSEVVPSQISGHALAQPEVSEAPESREPEEAPAAPRPENLTDLDIEAELAKVNAEGEHNG